MGRESSLRCKERIIVDLSQFDDKTIIMQDLDKKWYAFSNDVAIKIEGRKEDAISE